MKKLLYSNWWIHYLTWLNSFSLYVKFVNIISGYVPKSTSDFNIEMIINYNIFV